MFQNNKKFKNCQYKNKKINFKKMKIIRIPLLEDKYSINCIEISYDDLFLAFEGPENSIWIYKYNDIRNIIEYESDEKKQIVDKEKKEEEKDNSLNDIERYYWFREPLNFQKIIIQEHRNTISALRFLHKDSHFLFSSGFDKFIIIWKLDESSLTAECMRKIPARQEITDMKLFPDDKYLLVGYINGEINIYFCDYKNNSFTLSGTFLEHDDFLNSIVLSPNIINDGLFASLSDKGKLILTEIKIKNNDKINFNIKKIFPFENKDHFNKGDTKKIDWSPEGSMLISVDHQFIQTKKIIHMRLIFLDDLENTQPLIGHVSSPLIAKFSKCNYVLDNETFQLLATCDRTSNIKLWKVFHKTRKCKIFFTNDDFSDSIIRDIIFSNDGKYLFIVSSFGSISIIVFEELNILNSKDSNNININNKKKKIVPELISGLKPIILQDKNKNYNQNDGSVEGIIIDNESINSNNQNNNYNNRCNKSDSYNPYNREINQILNMNIMKSQLYQNLDHVQQDYFNSINKQINSFPSIHRKVYNFDNIKTKEGYNLILIYENNIPYNISTISLKLSNNYIIYMKQIDSFIKLFAYNNICFAYYDSRSTINIFSLLGTPLYLNNYISDVTTMDLYENYILIVTNDNQIIISDYTKKKNIYSNKLLCLSLNNTYIMQKINNLYFLGLNNIIIEIIESSIYSNITKKKIIYYNSENNTFSLSQEEKLTLSDKCKINEKEKKESFYTNLLKQIDFDFNVKYSENDYLAIDKQINDNFENFNNRINLDEEKKIIFMNLKRIANAFKNLDFITKDFEIINKIA